jgi:uncharacterized repeat protein (TIGR01451 family)/uncharacterized delta-60 repeat protein
MKNWQHNVQWLIVSSTMAMALSACQGPVQEASFSLAGQVLGDNFVDGSQIQPAEAVVKNLSDFAGTPPPVSFNISSDLEFIKIDNASYHCIPQSDALLLCTAKDGIKLEPLAEVSLKPTFELTYKNISNLRSGSKTRASGLITFPISIGIPTLPAPIVFIPRTATASSTGFDLIVGKTVSKPFILGANGGSGEFTLTANVTGTPPSDIKLQDDPLPAGYSYAPVATINANNPAWNCVITVPGSGKISCKLKTPYPTPVNGQYPPLKLAVNMTSSVATTTQLNCPWLYPILGDDDLGSDNHLGSIIDGYTNPCAPYTPIRSDLAITKTQIAPLTPTNTFYWGFPGKYQIIVSNNTVPATAVNGPITVTDMLSNLPAPSVLAFTQNLADIFLAADGWTITEPDPGIFIPTNTNGWYCLQGVYPNITCKFPGSIPAGGTLPPLTLGVKVKPVNSSLAIGEINCASVPNDFNNNNNQSCVTSQNMALESYDLKITKTHSNTSVAPGDVVTYSLNVQNIGGSDAPGPITVTDTIPAAFSSAIATVTPANAATCSGFPTVTCISNSSLPPGSSFTVNIAATSSSTASGTVTNTASVSGYINDGDTNTANNASSDPVAFASQLNLYRAESIVQASNGDFIVVGSSDSATRGKQFTVRRYASDGTTIIWTKVEDFSAADDTAFDLALDSTGSIVVVGRANLTLSACDTRAVVVKYDATGAVLTGFPQFIGATSDGKYDYFGSVALDSTNRIVTGGSDGQVGSTLCGSQAESRFTIHRFINTGIPDTSFGTAGRVQTDVSSLLLHTGGYSTYGAFVQDILVEENNDQYRIYAAGSSPNTTLRGMTVARYTTTGALDTTWGASTSSGSNGIGVIETNVTNGAIVTNANQTQDSVIREIGLQTVNNIKYLVATGFGCGANDCSDGVQASRSCVVTRYTTSNGAIDNAFGSNGAASFGASNTTNGSECNAMAINNTTNEIAVSGSSYNVTTGTDYLARKIGVNGALGLLYGSDNPNGYATSVIATVAPRADRSWGITWTAAGNIMTVGYTDKDITDKDEWVVKGY